MRLCDLVLCLPFVTVPALYKYRRDLCSKMAACIFHVWPDQRVPLQDLVSDPQEIDEIQRTASNQLSQMDRDFLDMKSGFRFGRRSEGSDLTNEELEAEDDGYRRWSASFDVEEHSPYPDEYIYALQSMSYKRCDKFGRKFWRVRRLEDMEQKRQRERDKESNRKAPL